MSSFQEYDITLFCFIKTFHVLWKKNLGAIVLKTLKNFNCYILSLRLFIYLFLTLEIIFLIFFKVLMKLTKNIHQNIVVILFIDVTDFYNMITPCRSHEPWSCFLCTTWSRWWRPQVLNHRQITWLKRWIYVVQIIIMFLSSKGKSKLSDKRLSVEKSLYSWNTKIV